MKNKIYKICGVALALVLVFSLLGAFAPAKQVEAQAYTPNMWNTMTIPSGLGQVLRAADVADFAVGSDGTTIYTVDTQTAAILRSTNGGQTFTALANPAINFTPPAILVAVAPDDPNVVVIVDSTAANRVHFSTNGGATWSDLGAPTAVAAEDPYDLAISITRAEAILGRDIVVTTSNTGAGAFGDVYLVGTSTTWAGVGLAGLYDYTSVAFEPNWVGGRAIVAIGSSVTGTNFQVIRTTTPVTVIQNLVMAVTAVTMPVEVGARANAITSSSLALPSDFDSTFPPAIQAYIGFNSAAGFDDVYRVDFNFTRKLGIAANVGIHSISFCGTLTSGTLFAGESATTRVRYSEDPWTSLPSWSFSYKAPTGATNTIVCVAPDFDSSMTVYAGTSGAESGFSKTTNGGVSYNQLSLIDTTIAGLDDVMPTPDNSTVFLSTNTRANSSLWKSSTPPSVASWERVRLRATLGFIIRLSPEYLDDSTIYWCDTAPGVDIQKSNTGGDIFANRTAPAAITDLVVESADIVYMGDGTSVRKSTNGAWFFGLPITANVGVVNSLAMAPTYPDKPVAGNVLVGGTTGGVSLSINAADSFIPLLAGAATGAMQVLADKNYATNNLIYAGSATVGQGIYRYEFGTSTAWESIDAVAGVTISGLAMHCGVLYGAWSTVGIAPSAVERSLVPFLPDIASLTFETMNVGAGAAIFTAVPSALRVAGGETEVWLWAIDTVGTGTLMGYNDTVCKAGPKLKVPADVGFDPTSGRNAAFTITWNKVSNAMFYECDIYTDSGCSNRVLTSGVVVPPAILGPSWSVAPGLISSGATYYTRVRVRDEVTGDLIRSPWSAVESFTIETGVPVSAPGVGPTLLGPIPGSLDVPLKPGFSWGPMAGTTEYEFILATDATLSSPIAGTPVKVTSPSWQCPEDLAYNTTYFWGIKASKPTVSAQSIGTFTTVQKPVPAPAPPAPAPPVEIPPSAITPGVIWAIIAIGAILVIAVIVLIVRTRRIA